MRSAFILGADSAIGSAIWRTLSAKGVRVTGTTRRRERVSDRIVHFDLARDEADSLRPEADVAFLCAAVTSMDGCETDPTATRDINVRRLLAVAERLHSCGTFLVFPSTSAVFDGTEPCPQENSIPRPANEYGRQKAEAESLMMAFGSTAVVRLTKVLSPDMELLKGWRNDLLGGRVIRPFNDLVLAPVSMRFAVALLQRIGERRLDGVFHGSGAGDVTYADFARLLAEVLGADGNLVAPTSSESAGAKLPYKPRFAALGMRATTTRLGTAPQPLEEVLSEIAQTR